MNYFIFLITIMLAGWSQAAEPVLQISPQTFDFGWAPDNAIIGCNFTLKNMGSEMIPLTSVQPACGCTATDFTPDGLPSAEEKKINITFNTRGYSGVKFNKSVQMKAGSPEQEYTVHLEGHVNDSSAKVVPEGSGVVEFSENSGRKQKVAIQNKSDETVDLSVVQEPASWATLKLAQSKIDPGKSTQLEVKADGPLDKEQNTSVTFDVHGSTLTQRLTIAFRTGPSPTPYRRIRTAPKSGAATVPSPTDTPTPLPK